MSDSLGILPTWKNDVRAVKSVDNRKSMRDTNHEALAMSKDELTQLQEHEQGEQWSRSGHPFEVDTRLRNDLESTLGEVGGLNNSKKKHEYLETWFKGNVPSSSTKFMSYASFKNFMSGTRQSRKGVKQAQHELLQCFIQRQLTCSAKQAVATPTAGFNDKGV
jgi:hypothetical protein